LLQLVAMTKQPVTGMSYLVDTAQRAIAGSRDYFSVLDEPSETETLPESRGRAVTLVRQPGTPAVEFDAVDFSYDPGQPVLDSVSFEIAPGERVAFVGESGGGKTTIVSLLLRLYRPQSGTVRLSGHDVGTGDVAAIRSQVGVVFQEASLFSGTIRENITYGRPDATDAEVEAAATRAQAHGFITGLKDGYETQIGERGVKLSGGQKQRIAIARAILADPPVLVLDEATSSLDTRSERLVQAGLDELMADRTSLIVAHRLSTIASVDRIVTLKGGRIDEIGPPDELATSGGIYAQLLALQESGSKADRKKLRQFDIAG
ncbi:MAG TPA: ABC transporter ATP-binding protein, partial [Propionibacteriaceae bacterium]|nr:ABC transporter ATP-binding protein [Propionibacteriaceae bacterium]